MGRVTKTWVNYSNSDDRRDRFSATMDGINFYLVL